jgi:hypothetical protein
MADEHAPRFNTEAPRSARRASVEWYRYGDVTRTVELLMCSISA